MSTQESRPKRLGTTAYAVLGLLALKDWTTYDLAVQMERGVGQMWAASPSMVYQEPKNLVAHGLASVRSDPVGRRPRAVYSITDSGRSALRAWLAEPPDAPALQFEGLLKVLFADQADTGALTSTLALIRSWATESHESAQARAQGYLEGEYISGVALDERLGIVARTLTFLADYYALVERWSVWATDDLSPAATLAALNAVAAGVPVLSATEEDDPAQG